MTAPHRNPLRAWLRWSLLTACLGAGLCAALCWKNLELLWQPYLFAYFACWLVAIGGLGLAALGNLTGGQWYAAARPFYLAAAQTIPLLAILFIPIAAFAEHIFPWMSASPGEMALAKEQYLSFPFFAGRTIGYFVVWIVFAWLLTVVSRPDLPPASTPGMRAAGAIGLVTIVPTATFAAYDWGMSLEPEWYSSIYGALASAGGVLAAHSLAILGLARMGDVSVDAILRRTGMELEPPRDERPGIGAATPTHAVQKPIREHIADLFNDLGSLLLAFLMVWAYFSLSQFLLIWSANLPSEITWYMRRLEGAWEWMAIAIVLLHFALPFFLLLSRERKRSPGQLSAIAALLLVMYFVHVYWMIVPAYRFESGLRHAASVAALALVFGVWMVVFAWFASRLFAKIPLDATATR